MTTAEAEVAGALRQQAGCFAAKSVYDPVRTLPRTTGPQRPQPVFNTSPLLAQGFDVGVRYDY